MEKEGKPIFFKVFVIVVIILLVNIGMFVYQRKIQVNKGLTGLSIKDTIVEAYSKIQPHSRLFLLAQWALLILLLLFASFKDKRLYSKKNELEGINLEKMSKKSKTDLDTLYNILKSKKQLKVSTIVKLFKVNKNVAMEWCKILEASNLVMIDASGREPVVKIVQK